MFHKEKKLFGFGLLVAAFTFFGCTHTPSTEFGDLQNQLLEKDQKIEALESDLNQNKQEINTIGSNLKKKDITIEEYKKQLAQQTERTTETEMRLRSAMEKGETPAKMSLEAPLLPSQAQPGECFARVFIPPTYKTVTEKRLKRDSSERLEIIPAKYQWVEEKILVKQASQRLETIPAEYQWIEEKVLVKEATARLEEIPAKYEWVEETVLVRPAETVWKKGRGLIEKVDTTGEIMCLVEIPAVYKTVKKKVMTAPPASRTIKIPAEFKTVKKRVMVKPPATRTIEIPAEYQMVKVKKMVSPPNEKRIPISAEYQMITKTEQVSDGRMEWRRVLCETNMTPSLIVRIQKALQEAGHSPGPIDGIIGWRTNKAIKAYQKEKGLAVGALTHETIKSLGVKMS